ncbi:MAG: hypothetical protein K2V38_21640, partial [Gemmataceae bacterium]|nr:hypothetical protein [Gemmataceae bacterium]
KPEMPAIGPKGPVIDPKPFLPPKPPERPAGVVIMIDPFDPPKRAFDNPNDTATVPDLNGETQLTLTGSLRILKLGSLNGKSAIDASRLAVEEVVITGDLNGEAVVKLRSPNAKVTLGGYIGGNSRLTIEAPGGVVVLTPESGRLTGSAVLTVTAKQIDAAGRLFGGCKLFATLTKGGALKLAAVEEGAVVTYKKADPSDPAPTVEKGIVKGGAKVIAGE